MSVTSSNQNVGRREELSEPAQDGLQFLGQIANYNADYISPNGLSLPPSYSGPDIPQYPDGTMLWRCMRSQENSVTAKSLEPMNMSGSIFNAAAEPLPSDTMAEPEPSNETETDIVDAENPRVILQQSFSQDAKLIGQAKWSLSALDEVFTHMTSSFMEQIDFDRIDFEAIAQA